MSQSNLIAKPTPTVSVQMAVYNGERFLAATIESILEQHFTDFELVMVDDGSTDRTPEILAAYAARDARIRLLNNPTRQGVSSARNRALAIAQGRYVAITDADDLSHPSRLQSQVAFLDAHPEIGVLGAWASRIDEDGKTIAAMQLPVESALLHWALLFYPPIVHSASMMRLELLQQVGGYPLDKPCTVDYDLWLRLAKITQFHTLPAELVAYRVHPYGISAQRKQEQSQLALQLSQTALSTLLGKPFTMAETAALRALALWPVSSIPRTELEQATRWLPHLYRAYWQTAKLTAREKHLVAAEIARCYRRFARQQKRTSYWTYLYYHVQALRFQPHLPRPPFLRRWLSSLRSHP